MKKVKSLLAVAVLSVLMTGCSLSVIRKDKLNQGLSDLNNVLVKVQDAICTQEGQARIDQANAITNALIEKYGTAEEVK